MVVLMKPPIFVRKLSKEEREALKAGLRSKDAFVLRPSRILLASSRGASPPTNDSQGPRMRLPDGPKRHPHAAFFDERGLLAAPWRAGLLARPKRTPAPPSSTRRRASRLSGR